MNELTNQIIKNFNGEIPVIVCIGTDIVSGDCLGPLVGKMLIDKNIPAYVYGTFSFLVNAKNINYVNKFIKQKHPDKKILAIDSCVGNTKDIGKISVFQGSIYPAAATFQNSLCPASTTNNKFFPIGDISITAVTTNAKPYQKEFSFVRLGFVFDLAKQITDSIYFAVNQIINNSANSY